MFNREIQVKFAKTGKKVKDEPSVDILEESNTEEHIDQIVRAANSIIFKVTLGVCAYVLVDAYRQVLIAHNTPQQEK